MKRLHRLSLSLLAVASFAITAGSLAAAEPVQIRVLCYNIHHGEGTDGKLDLPRIAKIISAEKPDLVSLQEVDQKTRRTGQVDQPAELAQLTKMNVVFGGNLAYQGGWYGNAMLSRFPISMKNHPLPRLREGESRGLIEADVEIPGLKQPLKFLATHFDYRGDDTERVASAKLVRELSEDWADRPAILTGDLNDTPQSQTLTILKEDWAMANDPPQNTFPSDQPRKQIDYILLRPKSGWKVLEFRVLEEPVASDHRPIMAVLEWTGGETK